MILFVPLQAHALYIVDTGQPDPGVGSGLSYEADLYSQGFKEITCATMFLYNILIVRYLRAF